MRRILLLLTASMLIVVMATSTAFAHECANVNKKTGAGSVGTFTFDPSDPDGGTFTPSGKQGGGFVTVTDGESSYDIFINNTLPKGAQNSGPGDSLCDGKGVDNALDCLGLEE